MHPRLAALLALLLIVTGCDTAQDEPATFGAGYVVGTWTFSGLTDSNGQDVVDRTDRATPYLDAYAMTFGADGDFRIVIDLSQALNDDGFRDIDFADRYTAGATRLTFAGLSTTPAAVDEDTMTLTAAGEVVTQILGLDPVLDLNPSATIRLSRQ